MFREEKTTTIGREGDFRLPYKQLARTGSNRYTLLCGRRTYRPFGICCCGYLMWIMLDNQHPFHLYNDWKRIKPLASNR
ncbi:hypothetical protein HMPREF0083_05272 [Aneurinibacillus aneurinilyticus ATCC 12856]|uniref:Uncharacterized protein n=1 Tax=Aneurinibacillus aneurinilyticus ATCC 12856 TaxID=649747 RepID=U1WWM8_ANEAE|nr:hypothetical protein HMPREF0083_05272 [Aneurinibacillus aneurinilyticus ATCC 12856]